MGVMVVTERDRELFGELLRFGFLTVEQVTRLWNVDFSTASARIRKLENEGLIERARLPHLSARPLLLTEEAQRLVGSELRAQRGVRPATFAHDLMLFDLAHALLRKFPGSRYETEREYRLTHSEGTHLPDGIFRRAGDSKVAVELELTHKAPTRLKAIIDGYALDLEIDQVWYFVVDPGMRDFIKRVAAGAQHVNVIQWKPPEPRSEKRTSVPVSTAEVSP